jgi:hypothetical protein
MPGETKHGIECSLFEALLSEALDGQLSSSSKERFDAHGRICSTCGPLLADAVAGRQWLKSLQEVEPPAHLMNKILAATSGISSARLHAATPERRTSGLGGRVRQWWDSFITPTAAFVRQPRFVMSFGMIFFSFSLALSAMGVKPADVAKIDVRPSALKRTYYTTQGKVVKFYENIRFVYEIESRVREFKQATTPAEQPAQQQNNNNRDNNKDKEKDKSNTSGQPEPRQERNYSQEGNQPVVASLPNDPPVVSVTTYRRLS